MNSFPARLINAVFAGVIGAAFSASAEAGNLTRCDEVKIAAHETIMDAYDRVLAALDARIERAKLNHVDLANYPYRDRDGRLRTVDISGLREDLQSQEEKDAGRAVRRVASSCDSRSADDAAVAAKAISDLGISSVLASRMKNSSWPSDPFGSGPETPVLSENAPAIRNDR